MMAALDSTPALITLGVLAFLLLMFAGDGYVYIRNDRYGVVERRWSFRAARKRMGFMTVDGGAGFLPDTIKGGWHLFVPFQYKVHRQKLITVRNIGYLFARTGAALAEARRWPRGPPTPTQAMRPRFWPMAARLVHSDAYCAPRPTPSTPPCSSY